MSSSAEVAVVLKRVLTASCSESAELDEPTLGFLVSLVTEEIDFARACPGSLSGAQLLALLSEKLEDTLVSYELAKTEDEGRAICALIVSGLSSTLQLAPDGCDSATAGATCTHTSAAALLAAEPPRLSASVRLSDVIRAQEAAVDPSMTSMATIQRHKTGWSAAEEAVLFQSLADVNADERSAAAEAEDEPVQDGGCELCERQMALTRHHLIPRKVHKQGAWARMSKEQLNTCALICRPCHSAIHAFEDERSLALHFNTIPLLLADVRVQKWRAYISKRKVNRAKDQAGAKGMHYGR